jgi:FkbM family methyltransferase
MMRNPFKQYAQVFLKRIGLYQRIRSSYIYDFYWAICDRTIIDNRQKEVEFYRKTLNGFQRGDLVFDIGANQGQKTDVFLRLGARVVAVEPDEASQKILEQRFASYRLRKKAVAIVGKAVSDKAGRAVFLIDQPGSAKNTLNRKWADALRTDSKRFGRILEFQHTKEVETTTLDELIVSYGPPFYIKIDVEGHELAVLKGIRSVVSFVSFEVNLPDFRPEAVQCIRILERMASGGQFNYTVDCVNGLTMMHWLRESEFIDALNSANEPCIEVFWKAPGLGTDNCVGHGTHGACSRGCK